MRIVGGSLRGRVITPPVGQAVRPTSDRIRQAIFNILDHAAWAPAIDGAQVLDAFCGSGALAFEALSRGAHKACLLDIAQSSVKLARANAQALGLDDKSQILRADATKPPAGLVACDLVFLDPPYDKGLIPPAITALAGRGWLAPQALLVLETRASETLPPPESLACSALDQREWGETGVCFWQFTPAP